MYAARVRVVVAVLVTGFPRLGAVSQHARLRARERYDPTPTATATSAPASPTPPRRRRDRIRRRPRRRARLLLRQSRRGRDLAAGPHPADDRVRLCPSVPAGMVAAAPSLSARAAPGPRWAEPAGSVTLPVAPRTAVDAVTAGTLTVIPAGGRTSTIVLSGTDGAVYT